MGLFDNILNKGKKPEGPKALADSPPEMTEEQKNINKEVEEQSRHLDPKHSDVLLSISKPQQQDMTRQDLSAMGSMPTSPPKYSFSEPPPLDLSGFSSHDQQTVPAQKTFASDIDHDNFAIKDTPPSKEIFDEEDIFKDLSYADQEKDILQEQETYTKQQKHPDIPPPLKEPKTQDFSIDLDQSLGPNSGPLKKQEANPEEGLQVNSKKAAAEEEKLYAAEKNIPQPPLPQQQEPEDFAAQSYRPEPIQHPKEAPKPPAVPKPDVQDNYVPTPFHTKIPSPVGERQMFISLLDFKDVLEMVDGISNESKVSADSVSNVQAINKDIDTLLERWNNNMESMEKGINNFDNILFKDTR